MTEWLDLMLDEVRRKKAEETEIADEAQRRDDASGAAASHSKNKKSTGSLPRGDPDAVTGARRSTDQSR